MDLLEVGTKVRHEKYGEGTIEGLEPAGNPDFPYLVAFPLEDGHTQWLDAKPEEVEAIDASD